MSTPDNFRDEPPPRQGMSTTAKVLLVLGSIAGVCLLACCGGGIFLYYKTKDAIQQFAQNFTTSDPAEIRARTARIVHIDIPPDYPPMVAFDWFVMKQIMYGKEGRSMVMIMEMNQDLQGGQGPAAARQQRQQFLQQMRMQQQGQQGQPGSVDTELTEESSETREFTINGEKVPFEFIKGTAAQGGAPTRQIFGVFPGRNGNVMIMMMMPEAEYDENVVVKMLESIRLPPEGQSPDDDDDPTPPAGVNMDTDAEPDQQNRAESEASPDSSP